MVRPRRGSARREGLVRLIDEANFFQKRAGGSAGDTGASGVLRPRGCAATQSKKRHEEERQGEEREV
jgi:hypothetical protein